MYAVIRSGGKQYKVFENSVVKLEKIEGKVGDIVRFDDILALGTDKGINVNPSGSVVTGEILEQKKDKKVIIFKKKRRKNCRKKNGHRQEITIFRVYDVSGKGSEKKPEVKKVKASPDNLTDKNEKKVVSGKEPVVKANKSEISADKNKTAKKDTNSEKVSDIKKEVKAVKESKPEKDIKTVTEDSSKVKKEAKAVKKPKAEKDIKTVATKGSAKAKDVAVAKEPVAKKEVTAAKENTGAGSSSDKDLKED